MTAKKKRLLFMVLGVCLCALIAVLILRDLIGGTKRFGELQRSVGQVSQKVLTSNLREMEADALVERKVYAEVPPRVEYSLTALGQSLKPILDSLWAWGENYKEISKCL